jgi:hypothetical protein
MITGEAGANFLLEAEGLIFSLRDKAIAALAIMEVGDGPATPEQRAAYGLVLDSERDARALADAFTAATA